MPEPHFGQVPVVIALETSRSEFLGQWAGRPNRMIEQKKQTKSAVAWFGRIGNPPAEMGEIETGTWWSAIWTCSLAESRERRLKVKKKNLLGKKETFRRPRKGPSASDWEFLFLRY